MRKSNLLRAGLAMLIVLLCSATVMAQRSVTGFVQDATSNLPLDGATISIKGSNATTQSKEGGKFQINAPSGKFVLLVSFVGYTSTTINVGANESNIIVSLSQSASSSLNEVVVVGYGTKKKVDLTGAISTVSSTEID